MGTACYAVPMMNKRQLDQFNECAPNKPREGCWPWAGKTVNGYGYLSRRRRDDEHLYAHRASYEQFKGAIPGGYQIDHLCRNRSCVNPDHLEAVTQRENLLRGEAPTIKRYRDGVCSKGHRVAGNNAISNGRGGKVCRRCRNAAAQAWKKQNAAKLAARRAVLYQVRKSDPAFDEWRAVRRKRGTLRMRAARAANRDEENRKQREYRARSDFNAKQRAYRAKKSQQAS